MQARLKSLLRLVKSTTNSAQDTFYYFMQNTINTGASLKQSDIALLAYQLWEKEGRPDGRDTEFWLKAEAQLAACQRQSKDEVKTAIATAKAAPPAVKAPVQAVSPPIKPKQSATQTLRRRK